MEAVRRHPLAAASVLAAVAVLLALVVPLPGSQSDAAKGASRAPSAGAIRPTPGASPSMSPAAKSEAGSDEEPGGLVRRPMTVRGEPLGLSGDGGSLSIKMRRINLSVRSSEPIGVIGYNMPTSKAHPSGVARGVGRSWSLSTTVYGRPDYAQLFMQAGPSGASITCTITVDGTVTEQRSSSGPYGQLFCQG